MNNFIDNTVEFLSHPFVILLFLVIIGYCIWYRKSGQEQRDKEDTYKFKKQELKKEREELNQAKYNLEREKEDFENHKQSIVYIKESSSTIVILLIFLIISVFINVYLLHELQEYYRFFGELKEMSEFLKMLL